MQKNKHNTHFKNTAVEQLVVVSTSSPALPMASPYPLIHSHIATGKAQEFNCLWCIIMEFPGKLSKYNIIFDWVIWGIPVPNLHCQNVIDMPCVLHYDMQRSEFHNSIENINGNFVLNHPFVRWESRCVHNTDIYESVAIRPRSFL